MLSLLDIRTVALVYVGIRIGLAIVLAYLWCVQRNYPPAKDWAVGALMTSAGLFLMALRDLVPFWVSELLSNALLLPGWMIFDYGIVRASGKTPPLKLGLVLCALTIGSLIFFGMMYPSRPVRLLIYHMFFIIFDGYAAYACLTHANTSRRTTFRLVAMLLIILVASHLWRVADDTFGVTGPLWQIPSRTMLLAVSVVVFPMIAMLLALQTSQKLQEEINDQAHQDMLTGAYNRRAFDEFIKREWSRAIRHNRSFSMIMVDIDFFKEFNDKHGHQAGDEALVLVSNVAQNALRTNDIWCRYGGEEFVALLPDTSIEQAFSTAERLRAAVEKTSFATPNGLLNISVSIGVAERTSGQLHWEEILAISDSALYKAKAEGRNRVVMGTA
jgi:diguanylate cyclase (GGDEF)-like protein